MSPLGIIDVRFKICCHIIVQFAHILQMLICAFDDFKRYAIFHMTNYGISPPFWQVIQVKTTIDRSGIDVLYSPYG